MTIPSTKAAQSARYKSFEKNLVSKAETIHNNRKSPSVPVRWICFIVLLSGDESFTEDDGNIEMGEIIPDIDPINKRPIEKPCRNKICNHIYDLDSIKESLKETGRIRCPVVGCNNKKNVILEDLVEDSELQRKLFIQRSRQAR